MKDSNQLSFCDVCPERGDVSDDCADCIYGAEYHFVDGECVRRNFDPAEQIFEAPKEISR